jgi:hypothetical protein
MIVATRPVIPKRRVSGAPGAPPTLLEGEIATNIMSARVALYVGGPDGADVRLIVEIPAGGQDGDLLASDGAGGLKWVKP